LPKDILEIPTKYPVNIHPSLLPKYRGPAPVSTAILNGDKYTGVTMMVMSEKMDSGDILASARLKIAPRDTTASLETKLANLGASLIHHVLHLATIGKIEPQPQDHTKATYTKILKKEDGLINWKNPPENLERLIRAYYPWPGVWCKFRMQNSEFRIKLLPNKMVQVEGKDPVSLQQFKSGHKDFTLDW
jgi:methionyl-tRNA formyltransferase